MWQWLRNPSARYSAGMLLVTGGIGGIVFWGGFNTFLEYTNTMEFCVS
jgi:nitrate/TMAO reductase-like tetraheme cytochrome c subunit